MGTRVAPTYANLYMADFEEKYVYTYPKQPSLWLRYIDNIYMLWPHGLQELYKFIDHLNSRQETISFTHNISEFSADFLDTTVKHTPGMEHSVDLFTKPTDSHNYLHYDSCHPRHIRKSLPYSQLLRLHRNCTALSDFFCHSLDLVKYFTVRDYPTKELLTHMRKVLELDRQDLLSNSNGDKTNTQDQDSQKSLYFITEFNPCNPAIESIIMKYWPILGRSSATRPLTQYKIIFGYRRARNIKDYLVHAKLRPMDTTLIRSLPKCHRQNCKQCNRLDKSGYITSTSTKRRFPCVKNPTCQSTNLIYCITCTLCGAQYVGQTKNRVSTRWNNHASTIRTKKDLPLPNHMSLHNRSVDPPINIHVLEYIKLSPEMSKSQSLRDSRELAWIANLHTLVPHGLNLQD